MNHKPITIDTYRHRTTTKASFAFAASDLLTLLEPTRVSLANVPCIMAKLETWKSLKQKDDFPVGFHIPHNSTQI